MHSEGYSSRFVCVSVCLSVCYPNSSKLSNKVSYQKFIDSKPVDE